MGIGRRRTEDAFIAAFSADGRLVMMTLGLASTGDVRIVWLDAQTGAEVAMLKLGSQMVTGGDASRDGRLLALAHRDGETTTLQIWVVEPILRGSAPAPIATLRSLGGDVTRVDFSLDDRRVLTSGDSGIKLWDLASGREVLTLKADGATTGQAFFSPDCTTIGGGLDEDDRLWGWDATPLTAGKR